MKISDFPQDLEPRVGDILEIEQGDVCFEVRIIGITADGYLCEQDNVEGAVLLEGVALDQGDVADITGYITEERVRLDPKCWKGKKIGNPKTKMKGGVRVNNCVPEGQQEDIEEAGPFSYGYKKPRKGSVAYWAEKKRKEQEKGKPPIEPKDQMVGVAKVTKAVSEGSDNNVYFEVDSEKAYNHIMKKFRSVIDWDGDTMVAPQKYWGAIQELAYSAGGEAIEVGNEQGVAEGWGFDKWGHDTWTDAQKEVARKKKNEKQRAQRQQNKDQQNKDQQKSREQGVAEGYTGRETKDGTWHVFKDGQAVAVAGPFNSRDEAHAWIKKHKQGVSEAKSLKKRVRVVQGEHAGKTGWIREIKHGIHSTAPKRYYVDIDGGGQADNLPASALRLLKNQSDNQKGMAEGGYPSPHNYDSDEDYYAAVNRYLGKKGPRPGDDDWEETAPGDDIPSRRRHRDDDMDEAKYQGREVPLGKKMAGDVAKSKVYVRKPNGKVVKVNFGDKNMRIKKSNPARRKSFRARHNCDNPGPRWKARYWSCKSW